MRVTPNAKKDEVVDDCADLFGNRCLKVRVTASPVDGKANEAVIELMAQYLSVKKSSIRIKRGATARSKAIEVIQN